ncbi:fungal-specific transcription factor domain-containing protein [Macrophomina phaseolina]|uniref:Fungal-specific transcription factor domain-containing protein n=1 Tax=Macrophomina phaseolina TaxID=35725 RepID=A0ABQ8GJN1_9PEZI|nr:fungal-specific transcription factor domain-containing protein [Macrophomina phaseolina]
MVAYFDNVHPIYPFLNEHLFEQKAFGPHLGSFLARDPTWAALYYTVLALGCQYHGGGEFVPGRGKAWEFFSVALSLLPQFMLFGRSLANAQALVAMTIFSRNFIGLAIEDCLLGETARAARDLISYNANTSETNAEDVHRTFWVIYALEKDLCFVEGKSSFIADHDIGCPILKSSGGQFGDWDWPLTFARLARILTKTYESLFSVSATLQSLEEYYRAIDSCRADLEQWRAALPPAFQPESPLPASCRSTPAVMQVALRIRLSYYNLVIVLSRLTIHVDNGLDSERQSKSFDALLSSARSVLDLSSYIDQEPYMPIWILCSMPLTALFILFDFTVHKPTHPDTALNLKFLDVAAGYFSRLDLASAGAFPSGIVAEFAQIAHEHVRAVKLRETENQRDDLEIESNRPGLQEQWPLAPWSAQDTFNYDSSDLMDTKMPVLSCMSDEFWEMTSRGAGLDLMSLFSGFTTSAPFIHQADSSGHNDPNLAKDS